MSTTAASAPFQAPAAPMRLTRRGRTVLFAVALLVTLGTLVLAMVPSVVATDVTGDPVPATTVTVQPGDTVWDIASTANPGGDIEATVDDIASLNALTDAQLRVGQKLAVPTY